MLFNVPQYIDIEDKIVGPLTAKQLGWLTGGGIILLILWQFLDTQAFFIAAVIVGLASSAFAFYRPYNQTLIVFIIFSVAYVFRPRLYIWHRISEKMKPIEKLKEKDKKAPGRKKLKQEQLKEISDILDMNKYNKN